MKIYVTRHGQTDWNRNELMQGRTDIPLNETGIQQAKEASKKLEGIEFDAVYASPLGRAITTASVLSGWNKEDIIIDERIIEFDFGKYEGVEYGKLGTHMSLYWLIPEIVPAPRGVETLKEAIARTTSFLEDLKQKDYEKVLVVCHGGIIRPICGYLEHRVSGVKWRPKPTNCEIREYEL